MEAATGVNGTVDGLEVDHLNFQEIESPSEQTKSYIVLESPTPATLTVTNWSEHISCLISPGCNSALVVGQSGSFDSVSHLGFEALYTSPAPPKDHGGDMVTELTLGNYRSPNCINGEELLQLRKGLQEDSKEMLNRPRYLLADDSNKIANQVDTADFLPSQIGIQRPPLSSQFEQCYSLDVVNIDYPEPPIAKRKAIEFRGGDDKRFQASVNKNGQRARSVHPFAFQRFAVKDDSASPLAAGDKNLLGIHRKRISVRNFLKPQSKLNEAEKLQMFKLIVNHVNYLHSQGFILKHLRPSHFVILPSKQVRYVGPLVQDGQIGLSAYKTDPADCMEDASKRRRILAEGRNSAETSSTKHHKVFEHFMFSSLTVVLKGQVGKELDTQISRVKSSICEVCDKLQMDGANKLQNHTVIVGSPSGGHNSIPELLKLEERWYISPEELNEGICSSSSNIYSLGVLLFELFCHFESREAHFAAMLNLRHRILPPRLLSEHPREASICLWMLHPDASSRPKIRDILQCDVLREDRQASSIEHLSASIDSELSEAELLRHFLSALKEQKEMQTSKLMEDLGCIDIDLEEIKRRHFSREHDAKETILQGNSADMSGSYTSKESQSMNLRSPFLTMNSDGRTTTMKNLEQLENAYFSMRSKSEQYGISSAVRHDIDVLKPPNLFCTVENDAGINCMQDESSTRRGSFFEGLCKYACNKTFKVRGSLRNMDVLNSASVICSLSFDQNENYFAAAGASKKIKVFEFDALLNSTADIHYPVVEMPSKSKLSCVCWNGYIRNYLASTDYDGVVQLWDASTGQGFHQYSEHQKRAWSVDFSPEAPTKLASGSDDCSVKLWNIHEKNSINTIKSIANVCCVQFSSHSPHLLGFGSADYRIYCFDIRNTRIPWCTLAGHRKTVSYIKFVDSDTIVSASTDNTLKLWDLKKTTAAGLSTNACSLTMTGHTNEKNFVGLSVCDGYVLCGSETNEVYAYHKNFPMPITSYKFGYIDPVTGHEIADDHGLFVSSVCWRRTSNMVLAANSNGSIKLLQMV